MSWWEEISSWLSWLAGLLEPYLPYIEMAIVAIVAIVIERAITRRVRKAVSRLKLPPEAGNAILLATRVIILVAAVSAILSIGGIPPAWLVSLSALGGAAVGFASTRSLGNFIAGIYIMVARPFSVGDYVSIDGLEGEVVEISMNYTKLRATDGTLMLISNQKVLDSKIRNFTREAARGKLIGMSFKVTFDHSVPSRELEEALEAVLARWGERLPEKPVYRLEKWDKGSREYGFTFFVEKASEVAAVRDGLLRDLLRAWEELRAKRS